MLANRFDFLRLAFASIVLVFHMVLLAELASPAITDFGDRLAGLSVQGFFVVSGALVYGSFQRSKNLGTYAEKRARRLYPAYALIVLIPAVVFLFTEGPHRDIGNYLVANLTFLNFLQPTLPGWFENNLEPTINGSLWTLKIEVMFYMILPILSWFLTKSGRAVFVLIAFVYVGAEVWRSTMEWLMYTAETSGREALFEQLSRQLPTHMSFFISGIALWRLQERVKVHWKPCLIAGATLMLVSYFWMFQPLRAAGLALLIGVVAYAPGPQINAARYGDISYGVYITHFPIIQALVAAGLFTYSPLLGSLVTFGLVFLSSAALWRLVERPWLRSDSHYRRDERAPEMRQGTKVYSP